MLLKGAQAVLQCIERRYGQISFVSAALEISDRFFLPRKVRSQVSSMTPRLAHLAARRRVLMSR